jgi:ribosomal protein S18 acetylase RimI-like enzyme
MDAVTTTALLPDLPAGFSARAVDLDADAADVEDLITEFDAAVSDHPSEPPGELVVWIRGVLEDGGTAVVVHGAGGRLDAVAYFDTHDPAVPTLYTDVFVRPSADAALAPAVLGWALAAARAWRDGEGRAATELETGIDRSDERLAAAARGLGFDHARVFWRMERPLGPDVAQAPPAPAGVTVRLADGADDASTVHRLHEAAFAEHYGFHARDEEQFLKDVRRPVGYDPTQWWLAEVDGEAVGYLMGERRELEHESGGYVRQLGVVAQARGRGIARHLLLVAFAEHTRRGWAWTQLGVDADNHTGATALYRSVGMEPVETIDAFVARIVAEPTTRVPE